jgi:hypothetical protein
LEVVVWDKDLVKKDYMGEVAVPLAQWFAESEAGGDVVWDEHATQGARAFELVSARRRRRVSGRVFLQFGLVLPDDVPRGEKEGRAREILKELESKGERHMACLMDVPAVSTSVPWCDAMLIRDVVPRHRDSQDQTPQGETYETLQSRRRRGEAQNDDRLGRVGIHVPRQRPQREINRR